MVIHALLHEQLLICNFQQPVLWGNIVELKPGFCKKTPKGLGHQGNSEYFLSVLHRKGIFECVMVLATHSYSPKGGATKCLPYKIYAIKMGILGDLHYSTEGPLKKIWAMALHHENHRAEWHLVDFHSFLSHGKKEKKGWFLGIGAITIMPLHSLLRHQPFKKSLEKEGKMSKMEETHILNYLHFIWKIHIFSKIKWDMYRFNL